MDKPIKWEDYLHLVEFAYNNGYQSSIGMEPFKSLYSKRCITPLSWDNLEDQVVVRNDIIREIEE